MLFDTHVHFDGIKDEPAAVIERAKEQGVTRFAAIGGSPAANEFAVSLSRQYPKQIVPVIGYDRECAAVPPSVDLLTTMLSDGDIAGIGEIGLDFHYHSDTKTQQQDLLSSMLSLAREQQLPAVIHSREADDETLSLLREHSSLWKGDPDRIGVLHCFTGEMMFAEKLIELGFCISFSGIITFKNAEAIRRAASIVPDEKLLIETDSPYLAPVPFRGKPNEPVYVAHVAERLAEIRLTSAENIAAITTANANRLFNV